MNSINLKDLTLEPALALLKYFEFLTEVRRSQIMFGLKMFSGYCDYSDASDLLITLN